MTEPIIVAALVTLVGTVFTGFVGGFWLVLRNGRRSGNANGKMMTLVQEQMERYDRREENIRTLLAQNAETTGMLRDQQGTLQRIAEDLHRSVRAQEQLVERFDRHLFDRRQEA